MATRNAVLLGRASIMVQLNDEPKGKTKKGSLGEPSTARGRLATGAKPSLYFEDFLLFCSREIFDLLGLGVRDFFEFVERALLVVFADLLLLLKLLDGVFDVAPHAANRGAMIFEHLVNVLGKILAAVFGEWWNRN